MAATANALLLVAAISFLVISYLTNWAARNDPTGVGPARAGHYVRFRRIYYVASVLAPVCLVALAVHLTIHTILGLGDVVTVAGLVIGVCVAFTALAMAVDVWRHA